MADGFDRIARIRGGQQAPQTSNDAQFEAYRAAVNAANQASQQQGPPQGWRQANALERGLHWGGQFGESLGDIFGSREAWEEVKQARQDGSGLFGSVLNWLPRFAADLPGNMLGIPFMAPEKLGEVISGSPMQEIQNGYMPDYTLDTEQRLATLGDVGIDLLGLAFGGSGTALRTGKSMLKSMGRENLASIGAANERWMRNMSPAGRVAWDVSEEAGEEFAQQYLQEIRGDEEKHGIDALDEGSFDRALEGAFLGAVGGGIFSGGSLVLEKGIDAANKRAAKFSQNGQGGQELGEFNYATPSLISGALKDRDTYTKDYLSSEIQEEIKKAQAKEAQSAGVVTSLASPLAASVGTAEEVPMLGMLSSMVHRGNEGEEAANDIFEEFDIDASANEGKFVDLGIKPGDNAREFILNLVMKNDAQSYSRLINIFNAAIAAKEERGGDVELTIWKYPTHNAGKIKVKVKSVSLDNAIKIDAANEKRLNFDSDGDNIILSFLKRHKGGAQHASLYARDAAGNSMLNLEQLGLLKRTWRDDRNPEIFVKRLYSNNMDRYTASQIEKMNKIAVRMKSAFEDTDSDSKINKFTDAYVDLISALRYPGEDESGNEIQKRSDSDIAKDLDEFWDMMTDPYNEFEELAASFSQDKSESDSKAKQDLKDTLEAAAGMDPNAPRTATELRVIRSAGTKIEGSVVMLYRIIEGFALNLMDESHNIVFRNVFAILNERHSLTDEPFTYGDVIKLLALCQMQIRQAGQDKVDQLNSVFNKVVQDAVEDKLKSRTPQVTVDFSASMDWDAFYEEFESTYNEMAKEYNESLDVFFGSEKESDINGFLKIRIGNGDGEISVYDAAISVYGDKQQGSKSFTGGLTLNEFIRYYKDDWMDVPTLSSSVLDAHMSTEVKDRFSNMFSNLRMAWVNKQFQVYGDGGRLVGYFSDGDNEHLSNYWKRYKNGDKLSDSELDALFTEATKIMDSIISTIGPNAFEIAEESNMVIAGDEFVDTELFELFSRNTGLKRDLDLGRQRVNALCTLAMRSKYRDEIACFAYAKKILENSDLSTSEGRAEAILKAKQYVLEAEASAASKIGSNSLHYMIFEDIFAIRTNKIDKLSGDSSLSDIRNAFDEVDRIIRALVGNGSYEEKRNMLDTMSHKRPGVKPMWNEEMLAPPVKIAGELGIGNKLAKAQSYHSAQNGKMCAAHYSKRNAVQRTRDAIQEGTVKPITRDTLIPSIRKFCAKPPSADRSITVAQLMDADYYAVGQGEKATSQLGSGIESQAQRYLTGGYQTSYMNQVTAKMLKNEVYDINEAADTQYLMADLLLGPRDEDEAKASWTVEDASHRKKATQIDCEKFYRQAFEGSPQHIAKIEEIKDRQGWFAPDADLLCDMIEMHPHLIEAISPYTVELGVTPNGDYIAYKKPLCTDLFDLATSAGKEYDKPSQQTVDDIIWNWISSSPKVKYLQQAAVRTVDRQKAPMLRWKAQEEAAAYVQEALTKIVKHAMSIESDSKREAYIKEQAKLVLGCSIDGYFSDSWDAFDIGGQISDAISNAIFESTQMIANAVGINISMRMISPKVEGDEEQVLDIEKVKEAFRDASKDAILKAMSKTFNKILDDTRGIMLTAWALNQTKLGMYDMFDLSSKPLNELIDSEMLKASFRMSIGSMLDRLDIEWSDEDVNKILSSTSVSSVRGYMETEFSQMMLEFLNSVTSQMEIKKGNKKTSAKDALRSRGSREYKLDLGKLHSRFMDSKGKFDEINKPNFASYIKSHMANMPVLNEVGMVLSFGQLSKDLQDKISKFDSDLEGWHANKKGYNAKSLNKQLKTIVSQFNYEVAMCITNRYKATNHMLGLSSYAVHYASEIEEFITGAYDLVNDNMSDSEREYVERYFDTAHAPKFNWTKPLHFFDIISESYGATAANLAQRGSNAFRTGREGGYPERYAAFMYFHWTPNSLQFRDVPLSNLREIAVKNNSKVKSGHIYDSDIYETHVVLTDQIIAILGDKRTNGKSAGDDFRLFSNDIAKLSRYENAGSIICTITVRDGDPAEITNLCSAFANEERILKTSKKPSAITYMGGTRNPSDALTLDTPIVDMDGKSGWGDILSEWETYMREYAKNVISYNQENKIDKSSPLINSIWVLKHFVPCITLDVNVNGAPRTITVSYEQLTNAASISLPGRYSGLEKSDLMSRPGKLLYRDPDLGIIEIDFASVASAKMEIKSADSVALRLTSIAYGLTNEYESGQISDDDKATYDNADDYVRGKFAERYIDWSQEDYNEGVSAADFIHTMKPPSGRKVDGVPIPYDGNRFIKFLDRIEGKDRASTRSEIIEAISHYDPLFDSDKIKEICRNPAYGAHMSDAFTVIMRDKTSDEAEIQSSALDIYAKKIPTAYNNPNYAEAKSRERRPITITASQFDSSYEVPYGTSVVLDYAPDWRTLVGIITKCIMSESNIICTAEVADAIQNEIYSKGFYTSGIDMIQLTASSVKTKHKTYDRMLTIRSIKRNFSISPQSVNAGMVQVVPSGSGSGNKDLYRSEYCPTQFTLMTEVGGETYGLHDSGGVFTHDMAKNLPKATRTYNRQYPVDRTGAVGSVLMRADDTDVKALQAALGRIEASINEDGSIDPAALRFTANNGVTYVLNLSGMKKTQRNSNAILALVSNFIASKPSTIFQDSVFDIAKCETNDGVVVLFPVAATDSIPHSGINLGDMDITYQMNTVNVKMKQEVDMTAGNENYEEWAERVKTSAPYMKFFHLRVYAKNIVSAVKGRVSARINGIDIPVWSIIDGGSSATRVADGETMDKLLMRSLFDAFKKLSKYQAQRPTASQQQGSYQSVVTINRMPELPGTDGENAWDRMMSSSDLTYELESYWQRVVLDTAVSFGVTGKDREENADAVRFSDIAKRIVIACINSGVNPNVFFNPTDEAGNWTGFDSHHMMAVFRTDLMCMDDMCFFFNYITKDSMIRGRNGKLQYFCPPSSTILFDRDDPNVNSEYMFDGKMRMWADMENFNGRYNGPALLTLVSTEITNDSPINNEGDISVKSSANDQLGMNTTWRTGRGPVSRWAKRLHANHLGLTRNDIIGLITKYANRDLDDISDESEIETLDSDVPDMIPPKRRRINISEYRINDQIEDPWKPTKMYIPSGVLEKINEFKRIFVLFNTTPTVYRYPEGSPDYGEVYKDKDLYDRYYQPLKDALGFNADEVSWNDLLILVMAKMSWTPGYQKDNPRFLEPIPYNDFNDAVKKICEEARTENGEILAIDFIDTTSSNNQRYSLGIGTKQMAHILAKCPNAYKQYKGDQNARAAKIFNEKIASDDAIRNARNQLSVIHKNTSPAAQAQYSKLCDWVDMVRLNRGDSIDRVFYDSGFSSMDDDVIQREFINGVFGFARVDPERYAKELEDLQERKVNAKQASAASIGKEIIPKDPLKIGKVQIKRWNSDQDVSKFFNNATLLSRFMGLLSPLVSAMSLIDRSVLLNFDTFLLWLGEKGLGPYSSFKDAIEVSDETIAACKQDQNLRDLVTAIQMSRYNGDYNNLMIGIQNGTITPTQYLKDLKEQGNLLEKGFRKVAKWATAEPAWRGKRTENWVKFLAKMAADEGHTWLNEKVEVGNGLTVTKLEQLLMDDDRALNVAKLFTGGLGVEDQISQRALNLTLKADLAQDLAVSVIIETWIRGRGAINFGIAMTCTPFLKANIAFAHRALGHVMPCCTLNYLLAEWAAGSDRLQEMNPNFKWEMERARLYSSLREAAMMDIMNIGLPALAFLIGSAAFLEPPDDDDKWCNWEEWTIMGQRLDTKWWISDILGVAMPIACFWRSATLGKPTPQILMRGLSEVMMENPLNDVEELVDMVTDPNGYLDSLEAGLDYYENSPGGEPDGMQAAFATIPAIGGSLFGKLLTPSLIKEFSRFYPQYETSYNQIWEESDTGALTAAGAEGKTQKTTYWDAQLRKVSRNNILLGALLDLLPMNSQTSYIGANMPRQRIYDENQMNWMNEFSVVDESGNPKSAEEQEQVVGEIILMLQSTNDMDALYHDGFYLNSQTREACSKYIWDMYHELTNQWETKRANGDLDFYVLGNGDFEEGSEVYGEMKLAYNQSRDNLMSLYYDKLWSKELNQGLVVYNRYNTTWRQDANGNWYASGVVQNLGGLLNPIDYAPGTLEDPGSTTGWAGDWGTPSAVTGQSMYDENGNAMRALIPTVSSELDVPSLDSWGEDRNNGYSSNYGTIYNTNSSSTSDDGNNSSGNGSTSYPNRGTSGTRRYSSGGGGGYGGGGSAPYSHVSAYGPNNNSIKQSAPNDGTRIYEANLDYLRPSFETKGSREAYRREDL